MGNRPGGANGAGGYSAEGGRARGARPATDSGAGGVQNSRRRKRSQLFVWWVLRGREPGAGARPATDSGAIPKIGTQNLLKSLCDVCGFWIKKLSKGPKRSQKGGQPTFSATFFLYNKSPVEKAFKKLSKKPFKKPSKSFFIQNLLIHNITFPR